MTTQITDLDVITRPVDVVLQARFLARANQACIYAAGTQPGTLERHRGSNVAQWRRYEQLTPSTSALTELNGNVAFPTRDGVIPSITDVEATVARYGQHFVLNEETDLVNPTQQENELIDVLAQAAGRSINYVIRNEMEDNSTQIRSGGVAADGSIVTKLQRNDIRKAVNTLQRNAGRQYMPVVPPDPRYNTSPTRAAFLGFCHVDVEQDIRDMAGFIDVVSYMGQTVTFPNEIGSAAGVRWLATEEASATANGGGAVGDTGLRSTGGSLVDLYDSIVMGEFAVGTLGWGFEHIKEVYKASDDLPAVQIINIPVGKPEKVDPYGEYAVLGYKTWLVAKILNGNWIRRITSGATNLV